MTDPLSRSDQMFFAGVISALAVVKVHDKTVLFDEIVRSCGAALLIAEARRSGNMRWSGLDDYRRRHREEL